MRNKNHVAEAIRETFSNINWPRIDDLNRAINWELWHGELPSDYWTKVEPLENYRWSSFEQAVVDLREALESLPGELYVDEDGSVYLNDPYEDPHYYWSDDDDNDDEPTYVGPESYESINPLKAVLHFEVWSQI